MFHETIAGWRKRYYKPVLGNTSRISLKNIQVLKYTTSSTPIVKELTKTTLGIQETILLFYKYINKVPQSYLKKKGNEKTKEKIKLKFMVAIQFNLKMYNIILNIVFI